nr:DUF3667 domain-containing protein [Chryseolinea sp.]
KNCGQNFNGRFCNLCGEKVIEQEERTVKFFLGHVLNAFTFIDGKFWRSFKTMLIRPGKMTFDLVEGKRQPYMKPVAFFFVGNVIYFLLPLFETFNTSFHAQVEMMPYSAYVTSAVNAYQAKTGIGTTEMASLYNAQSTSLAKMLLILLAPLTLPFVALVNFSRKRYLSDHFLFSLEYSSYLLFVPTILFPALLFFIFWIGELFNADLNYIFKDDNTIPFIFIMLLYFFIFGNRNFYKYPWWRSVLSSVFLTSSIYIVLHLYRFILFHATLWTI